MATTQAAEAVDALEGPVALVLTGGGARGAAQAAAACELFDAGLRPDFIVGTSAGAWNAAWFATRPGQHRELLSWWARPEVAGLFRGMRRGWVRALLTRGGSVLSARSLQRLLAEALGETRFEEAALSCAIGAADLLSGELVYLDSGSMATAVLASSAIPMVFPAVQVGHHLLADGGVVDGYGIVEAVRRGARSLVVIDTATCELGELARGIAGVFDRLSAIATVQQWQRSVAAVEAAGATMHTLRLDPVCGPMQFTRARAVMDVAAKNARNWLAAGRTLPQRAAGAIPRPQLPALPLEISEPVVVPAAERL